MTEREDREGEKRNNERVKEREKKITFFSLPTKLFVEHNLDATNYDLLIHYFWPH